MELEFILNGKTKKVDVPKELTLLELLHDCLGLTGTKRSCEIGHCGACAVIVDGEMLLSCVVPAYEVEGCVVTTIEGIHGPDGGPNDMQQAFLDHGATQCGFCTPGMIIAGEVLLMHNPEPTREEIRQAISGNLCRCTGYQQIIDAIEATARSRAAAGGKEQS